MPPPPFGNLPKIHLFRYPDPSLSNREQMFFFLNGILCICTFTHLWWVLVIMVSSWLQVLSNFRVFNCLHIKLNSAVWQWRRCYDASETSIWTANRRRVRWSPTIGAHSTPFHGHCLICSETTFKVFKSSNCRIQPRLDIMREWEGQSHQVKAIKPLLPSCLEK